jgi:type II secretory pathway component GspD/PulD (secretin)
VTTLNNESVEFTIERRFGNPRPVEGAQSGDNTQFSAVESLTPIDVSLDNINVTTAGNITLNVDLEFIDYDNNLGAIQALGQVGGDAVGAVTATTPQPRAVSKTGELGTIRKTIESRARIKDGGTVVLGGWRSERTQTLSSGVPILRDVPFVGKYLFERSQDSVDKITLLIFITGNVVQD